MRIPRVSTPVAAALMALAMASPAPAAPPPSVCQAVAFSPTYAQDGTAFCYFFTTSPTTTLLFYVSTDGLKSWRQTSAAGFSYSSSFGPGQLVVSPLFPQDRTVYVQLRDGLYASTDLGESFTLVSNLITSVGKDNLTFYPEDLSVLGKRVTILFGDLTRDAPMRVQPPLHTPVPGSPDRELRFVLPPGYVPGTGTSFVLTERMDDTTPTAVLYSCNGVFACATEMHVFPTGHAAVEVYFAPDFATSRRMWVVTVDTTTGTVGQRLWASSDGGDTFVEDPTTVALAKRVKAIGANQVAIGLGFTSAKQMFLRWNYNTDSVKATQTASAPRANQLFRSDDSGRKWKQVGYSAAWNQLGKKGTLPWSALTKSAGSREIYNPAPGVLVTLGMSHNHRYMSVWCSRNQGRSWRTTC